MAINYEAPVFDLPEDINRAKLGGDFERVKELISLRLKDDRTSDLMRQRLILEEKTLYRWLKRFRYTKSEALKLCQSRIENFTQKEFDEYEKSGIVDFIYAGGEKRYLSSFCSTLIKTFPRLKQREINPAPETDDGTAFKPFYEEIKRKGEVSYRFKIKSSLKIEDASFVPGQKYLVHIPVPAPSAQQPKDKINISVGEDGTISGADAHLRCAVFERRSNENKPFETEFSFVSRVKYVDPLNDRPSIIYPDAKPPCEDDLSEQYPHIVFTPYLKALAKEIAGDETGKLKIAKKIYDYITLNVKYSFMRPYILIDRHAEYCAINLKGDCGIQAILFITLCRIAGIPARWQSGLTVDRFSTGEHDWAQFYTEEFGWLFADPSYGGGGTRQEDEIKRNFYFGNVDPFRMAANDRYQSEYETPKKFIRFDPCDNQDGEVEDEQRGYDGDEYEKEDTVLEFERV